MERNTVIPFRYVQIEQGCILFTFRCLNWNLPSSCHYNDAPPGLCCPQPDCGASVILQVPSAYQDQYPGYTYVN